MRNEMGDTCAICEHGRGLHADPSADPGHWPPVGCRRKRGCSCTLFYSSAEYVRIDYPGGYSLRQIADGTA